MGVLKDEHEPTAAPQPQPEAAGGWDPADVWRDRVQMPRLAQEMAREMAGDLTEGLSNDPADHATARVAQASDGWDPFQTWQYRVLRFALPGDRGD